MHMDTPMWDYSGSTIVSNNEIRLTPDHQSKNGRIWNTIVCVVLFANIYTPGIPGSGPKGLNCWQA